MKPDLSGYCLLYNETGEIERVPCSVWKAKAAGTYLLPIKHNEPTILYEGFNFFIDAGKAQRKLEMLTNFELGLPYA